MKHLLIILFLLPVAIFGQRLKIGKQLEKAPGINYMVLTDINGEQYYTPMSTVLGNINTDQSLGTAALVGNNLVITERNVLTGAIIATYTINLSPFMQTLTAVDNGNGTVTLNMTGDASPELIDICNIVSTHCNSDLTVSPTGLVTFTDNAGNSMTFNLISPVAGNDISYNNGLYLSETVTALSYNPTTHSLSYVNEAGATNTITLDVAGLTFNAGTNTITYTAENGVVTNIVLPADVVTTITNTINGNRIATYTNENGVAVDIEETITTIVDNGDGTYTFTNEAGATATFPAQVNTDTRLSLSVVNDSLRVDVVNIVTGATVSTSYIDNVINQSDVLTTLAYNSTTHTLTYTDENGVATNLPLDVATMTYNATTNTITYTAEDGTVTNIALPVETVTTVTNTIAGNTIATYTNENGVAVDINETITSSSFNAATNELTITNESGLPVTYQLNSDSTVVNGGDNITVTQVSPNVYEIDFIYNCDSIAACIPADIDTIVSGFAIVNDVATITLSSGQTYSATITHPADSTVVQSANGNLTVTEVSPNVYDVSFLYNCDSIQNCLTPLGIMQEPLVVAGDTTGYITNILDPVTGVTVRDTIFFPDLGVKSHSNETQNIPYTGVELPTNPGVNIGDTKTVQFNDGTVVDYTWDGTGWVVDFVEEVSPKPTLTTVTGGTGLPNTATFDNGVDPPTTFNYIEGARHDLRLTSPIIERGSDSATDPKGAQFLHDSYSHLNGFSDNWIGTKFGNPSYFRIGDDATLYSNSFSTVGVNNNRYNWKINALTDDVNFNFSQSTTYYPGGGVNNDAFSMGWNLAPGGGSEILGKTAIGLSFENNFVPTAGDDIAEYHTFFVDKLGVQHRLESYTIDKDVPTQWEVFQTVSKKYTKHPVTGLQWEILQTDNSTGDVSLLYINPNIAAPTGIQHYVSPNQKLYYIRPSNSATGIGNIWQNTIEFPDFGRFNTMSFSTIRFNGLVVFQFADNLPVYADNTAAILGGLGVGTVYRTSTGDLKVVY